MLPPTLREGSSILVPESRGVLTTTPQLPKPAGYLVWGWRDSINRSTQPPKKMIKSLKYQGVVYENKQVAF